MTRETLTLRRILHARRSRLVYLLRAWQFSLRREYAWAPTHRVWRAIADAIVTLERQEIAAYDADDVHLSRLAALAWRAAEHLDIIRGAP